VPIGGEPIKYELDRASGILVVDRFLYTSMRYPGNYGFSPHTLSSDGDPCDVLVVNTRAITPGAMMSVRPVGVLFMEDEAGLDEKIIAVPSSRLTKRYASIKSYSDRPKYRSNKSNISLSTTRTLKTKNGSRSPTGAVSKNRTG
jgi:inorganic pyrophosphatase